MNTARRDGRFLTILAPGHDGGGATRRRRARRILFFAENAQGWASLAPVALRLGRRTDLAPSIIAVSCPATEDHESWRFTAPESEKIFRDLYIAIADAQLLWWDIFVVSHASPFIDPSPSQHIVAVCHGSGFGTSAYSLMHYSGSTLFCGKSPAEADFIAGGGDICHGRDCKPCGAGICQCIESGY